MKPVGAWCVLLSAFFTSCSLAEYTLTGNHYSTSDIPVDFFDHAIEEFIDMFTRHDVDDLMLKYTENCIAIYEDRVIYGKLALREDFRTLLNDTGISGIKVTLLDGGMLGEDYSFMINEHCYFDTDGKPVGGFKALLIFSHVDGGFQTHITAMLDHGEKKCCNS